MIHSAILILSALVSADATISAPPVSPVSSVPPLVDPSIVTINASAYRPGSIITNVGAGATISVLTTSKTSNYRLDDAIVVANSTALDAGPALFGHKIQSPNALSPWDYRYIRYGAERCWQDGAYCDHPGTSSPFKVLFIAFHAPTDYVEVRAHYTEDWIDGSVLRAFNSSRELISTCRVPGNRAGVPQYGLNPPASAPVCGELIRRYNCYSLTLCSSEFTARIERRTSDIAYVMWGSEVFDTTGSAINKIKYRNQSP